MSRKINIREIICSTTADDDVKGDMVYSEIINLLKQSSDEMVYIDFENLELVNTAFLNNAIGRLFSDESEVDFKRIKFKNVDLITMDLLEETIIVANNRYR